MLCIVPRIPVTTAMVTHLRYCLQLMYGTMSLAWTPISLERLAAHRLSELTQRPLTAQADPRRRGLLGRMGRMIPCQRLLCLRLVGRHPPLLEEQASEGYLVYLDSDRTPSLYNRARAVGILLSRARLFRLDQSLSLSA